MLWENSELFQSKTSFTKSLLLVPISSVRSLTVFSYLRSIQVAFNRGGIILVAFQAIKSYRWVQEEKIQPVSCSERVRRTADEYRRLALLRVVLSVIVKATLTVLLDT